MLKNIDTLPVGACFDYLLRLAKLYVFFFLLQLLFFFLDKKYNGKGALLAILQLVFYGANCTVIGLTYYLRTISLCTLACFTVSAVTIINTIIMISSIVGGNYFALVGILSILISSTTIYIIYKIRGKLLNPNSSDGTANLAENAHV